MKRRFWLISGVGVSVFAVSFLVGSTSHRANKAIVIERTRSKPAAAPLNSAGTATNSDPSPRVLEVRDFGTASFPQLYRTLQSASPSTRLMWAKQIEQMRIGPRKHAAVCSFYKTLVQIDART